jgi:hypothetical protein
MAAASTAASVRPPTPRGARWGHFAGLAALQRRQAGVREGTCGTSNCFVFGFCVCLLFSRRGYRAVSSRLTLRKRTFISRPISSTVTVCGRPASSRLQQRAAAAGASGHQRRQGACMHCTTRQGLLLPQGWAPRAQGPEGARGSSAGSPAGTPLDAEVEVACRGVQPADKRPCSRGQAGEARGAAHNCWAGGRAGGRAGCCKLR